jgi:hypothetical protein
LLPDALKEILGKSLDERIAVLLALLPGVPG